MGQGNSAPGAARSRLDRHGRREVKKGVIRLLIQAVVLFISAGALYWPAAWAFLFLGACHHLTGALLLTRLNPEMLNARGRRPTQVHRFDKIIIRSWLLCQLAALILAGMDAGRFHWSRVPLAWQIAGFVIMAGGAGLILWAMAVNAHFETTVRIQNDRGHQVCRSGPYAWVRHPGYAGVIMAGIGGPLLLGSWVALLPALVTTVLFSIRTRIEDRILHADLPGYAEFAAGTRHRLLPGVW